MSFGESYRFLGFGGLPRFLFLGMILKKVFIAACLRGFFLSIFSPSLPLHCASSLTEELVAIVVLIDNDLTCSCCCRKIMTTPSSESYEDATSCCWNQHLVEGTVSPGNVRTYTISIFIEFLNRYRQYDVVCITIDLKLLIIDREKNRQSSTGSNVGLVPWGHVKPDSDANNVPLLLSFLKMNDYHFLLTLTLTLTGP